MFILVDFTSHFHFFLVVSRERALEVAVVLTELRCERFVPFCPSFCASAWSLVDSLSNTWIN